MATMLQLMSHLRAAAPGGLSIKQAADKLGTEYLTAASLISHAHGGRSKSGKVYHRREGHCGLYFADAADAEAFDMKAYAAAEFAVPRPSRAPQQTVIWEFVAGFERGATQEQIRRHAGLTVDQATAVIAQMGKTGRLTAIGPHCWKRYFTDAVKAQDLAPSILAEIAQTRAENKAASLARKNAEKRARWAETAHLRPPKPCGRPKREKVAKDQEAYRQKYRLDPTKVKKVVRKGPEGQPVVKIVIPKPPRPMVTLSACAAWMAKKKPPDVPATIPDHVKVQVCPGYRGDVRYLPQTDRVIGGFATMGIGRYLEPSQEAA